MNTRSTTGMTSDEFAVLVGAVIENRVPGVLGLACPPAMSTGSVQHANPESSEIDLYWLTSFSSCKTGSVNLAKQNQAAGSGDLGESISA